MPEFIDPEDVPEDVLVVTVPELFASFDAVARGDAPTIPDGPVVIKVAGPEEQLALMLFDAQFPGVLG